MFESQKSTNARATFEAVYNALVNDKLIPDGAKVVVGVSGGADSVFLLHALIYTKERGMNFSMLCAHFNHKIRGESADADEAFVKALSERLGVRFVSGSADVPAFARDNGYTLEQAGRLLRYQFLRSQGADLIAVAHHSDDQAESILMHIIRGSGLQGLCGMSKKSGDIIRPMLDISRSDIETALSELKIEYRTDETNLCDDAVRNKLRLNVFPYISREINRGFTKNLCAMAKHLSADEEYLQKTARDALTRFERAAAPGRRAYLRDELYKLPPPIRYRALVKALSQVGASVDIEERHINILTELLNSGTGKTIELPHSKVYTEYSLVVFMPKDDGTNIKIKKDNDLEYPFDTAEPLEFGGFRFVPGYVNGKHFEREPFTAYMDADKLPKDLIIRTRRPGDKFKPLGAPGSKKLKSYFIDKKTPKEEREVPIIVNADTGDVLYVTGHTIAESVRVTKATKRILKIKVERV